MTLVSREAARQCVDAWQACRSIKEDRDAMGERGKHNKGVKRLILLTITFRSLKCGSQTRQKMESLYKAAIQHRLCPISADPSPCNLSHVKETMRNVVRTPHLQSKIIHEISIRFARKEHVI